MATSNTPAEVYSPGKKLTLFPYEPVDPHGSASYTRIPLPAELEPGHIRDFDPDGDYTKTRATVQFEKPIRVDDDRYSQIGLCKVVHPPRQERTSKYQSSLAKDPDQLLVMKVYDYEYYPSSIHGPWDNDEVADGRFSREYSAYEHYHAKNTTGNPHIMPKFYGGWVTKVKAGTDKRGKTTYRYVGLILIEYIDGRSIEDLCSRELDNSIPDWRGDLIPVTGEVPFRKCNGNITHVEFNKKNRQLVIKKMLHGLVVGMHLGVDHCGCEPENVFVTMRTATEDLQEPRVVFLDHINTEVVELTDRGAHLGPDCLTELPFPPHPIERCSAEALLSFHGWWPPSIPDDIEASDEFEEQEKLREQELTEWLLSDEVFGPLKEAKDEWDQLKARGEPWPHPYAKYSTFETLDKIERDDQKLAIVMLALPYCRLWKDAKKAARKAAKKAARKAAKKAAKKNLAPLAIRDTADTPGPSSRPSPIRESGPSGRPSPIWQSGPSEQPVLQENRDPNAPRGQWGRPLQTPSTPTHARHHSTQGTPPRQSSAPGTPSRRTPTYGTPPPRTPTRGTLSGRTPTRGTTAGGFQTGTPGMSFNTTARPFNPTGLPHPETWETLQEGGPNTLGNITNVLAPRGGNNNNNNNNTNNSRNSRNTDADKEN